mmetsp:Transcript_29905/g.67622  ORF Transcript_29905/g.67622 Transcript_29905/m.67622 type:complete len:352 (-) Transcript_29905:340-1395(-)
MVLLHGTLQRASTRLLSPHFISVRKGIIRGSVPFGDAALCSDSACDPMPSPPPPYTASAGLPLCGNADACTKLILIGPSRAKLHPCAPGSSHHPLMPLWSNPPSASCCATPPVERAQWLALHPSLPFRPHKRKHGTQCRRPAASSIRPHAQSTCLSALSSPAATAPPSLYPPPPAHQPLLLVPSSPVVCHPSLHFPVLSCLCFCCGFARLYHPPAVPPSLLPVPRPPFCLCRTSCCPSYYEDFTICSSPCSAARPYLLRLSSTPIVCSSLNPFHLARAPLVPTSLFPTPLPSSGRFVRHSSMFWQHLTSCRHVHCRRPTFFVHHFRCCVSARTRYIAGELQCVYFLHFSLP